MQDHDLSLILKLADFQAEFAEASGPASLAHPGLLAGLDAALRPHLAGAGGADLALQILQEIGVVCLEQILTGQAPEILVQVYETARPRLGHLDRDLRSLPSPALDRLIADGYPHAGRLAMAGILAAAEEWLVRGSAYGRTVFRGFSSTACPAMTLWDSEGLVLPGRPLCGEGATLAADAIQKMAGKPLPYPIHAALEMGGWRMDWRVLACLLLEGVDLSGARMARICAVLGDHRVRALAALGRPVASRHAEIERRRQRRRLPSNEDILRMQGPSALLDPWLDVMRPTPGDTA